IAANWPRWPSTPAPAVHWIRMAWSASRARGRASLAERPSSATSCRRWPSTGWSRSSAPGASARPVWPQLLLNGRRGPSQAAARSASLGIDGLVAGLDDHLRLLSSASGPAGRHRSLRTVIDWSHDLLDAEERTTFRRLAIFAGAFDLDGAAAVATDGDVSAASDRV